MAQRAADLPAGSIIACRTYCYIKNGKGFWSRTGDSDREPEIHVQQDLDQGAEVLRVGTAGFNPGGENR